MSETSRVRGAADSTDGREYTRLDAFRALCLARFRESYREPEVLFWGFVFPIMLSVGLSIAFRNRPAETLPLAVVAGPRAEPTAAVLRAAPLLRAAVMEEEAAVRALALGKVALVVAPRAAGRRDPLANTVAEVREPGGRYIDFLIPGIVGMNLMSGGMWGVGFNL